MNRSVTPRVASLRRRGPFSLVRHHRHATARVRLRVARRLASAALRGGSAARPPHRLAHLAVRRARHIQLHRVARFGNDVRLVSALPTMVLPPVVLVLMLVKSMVQSMVPMLDAGGFLRPMRLGASLRDRATLPSPLRGLDPSGGYPSRLRSLTLTARYACPAARCAHRRCRAGTVVARFDTIVRTTRRVILAPALRAALVRVLASLALAGCAGYGQRLGSWRQHSVRRRCRLRRAPVPALVRAPPPPPSAACCARLPAAPTAPPPASSAAAAPLRRLRRRRFPHRSDRTSCRSRRPGAAICSHPTHLWCMARKSAHAASFAVTWVIVGSPARPWRAGKSDTNLVVHPPRRYRADSASLFRPRRITAQSPAPDSYQIGGAHTCAPL